MNRNGGIKVNMEEAWRDPLLFSSVRDALLRGEKNVPAQRVLKLFTLRDTEQIG